MSIVFEKKEPQSTVIVYRIENDDEFYIQGIDFTEYDRTAYDNILNPVKKRQWLASRYWIKKISNQHRTLYLQKTELGKPQITNIKAHVSISHSQDCIAIRWSESHEVAIDIEFIQEKIYRIRSKFLHRDDILAEDIETLALIWSSKETIYKYFHSKELYSFKEQIAIKEIGDHQIAFELPYMNKKGMIQYQKTPQFIITWI